MMHAIAARRAARAAVAAVVPLLHPTRAVPAAALQRRACSGRGAAGGEGAGGYVPPPFEPVNALEESLVKASHEFAHRVQFYTDLLESNLYIIKEPMPGQEQRDGWRELEKHEEFCTRQIEANGKLYIPLFTSLERLHDVCPEEGLRYMALNARVLFEAMKGAEFLINPGCLYGKELTAPEIEGVLSGAIGSQVEIIESGSTVRVGEHLEHPTELVNQLKAFFAKHPVIKAAYIGLAMVEAPADKKDAGDEETKAKVHTLVSIDCDGVDKLPRAVLEGATAIAYHTAPGAEQQAVFVLHEGSGLESCFDGKAPFFSRDAGGAASA